MYAPPAKTATMPSTTPAMPRVTSCSRRACGQIDRGRRDAATADTTNAASITALSWNAAEPPQWPATTTADAASHSQAATTATAAERGGVRSAWTIAAMVATAAAVKTRYGPFGTTLPRRNPPPASTSAAMAAVSAPATSRRRSAPSAGIAHASTMNAANTAR